MTLPADYSPERWLHPLAFQGLIGRALADPKVNYEDLFRPGGFAKSIDELMDTPAIARLIRDDLPEDFQRDDDHHSSTKASTALLCTGIAGLIVAAGLLAMVAR